jgi:hypothetical protein
MWRRVTDGIRQRIMTNLEQKIKDNEITPPTVALRTAVEEAVREELEKERERLFGKN